jgi:hypothetical protein
MYDVSSPMPPSNTYKGGRISQGWAGFGKDMLITMASAEGTTANNYQHRPFVAGEMCWVTAITVQNDGVLFQLYSDPYNDVRYYANLKIPYPNKKVVPPADSFLQTIAEVVKAGSQDNQSGSGQAGVSSASVSRTDSVALVDIAPPPPPADAPPPTIALGQTKTQVTAGFGQPVRTAKVGVREIYYYKDMKVTFTSGKVTNVE